MPTAPISDQLLHDTVALVRHHGSIGAAERATGIPRQTLQHRVKTARQRFPGCLPPATSNARKPWAAEKPRVRVKAISAEAQDAMRGLTGGPPIPYVATPPDGFVIRRNSAQYDASGNLQRQWIESGQGTTDGYEIPAGHVVKGESALLGPAGNVLARWIKTKEDAGAFLVDALRDAFAEYDGAAPVIPAPAIASDDLTVVYPIPDLHFGMRAWGDETGSNWDVDIAAREAILAIDTLVAQSLPSSHAIIILLGDTLHANDEKAITPGSGHHLDVDGRYHGVYLKCAKLVIDLVSRVAARHARVTLVVLPGNHDSDAAMTLSVAMSLFYSANDRVSVYQKPGVFWYERFGSNLFGANHGHTVKTAERMAMAMASDRPNDWGETKHRSIWSGHLHHEVMKEVPGVRVETLTSPAARDAWNHASGFRSARALSAITFHRERGEIGRHRVVVGG
jgi:hypothetical protein